MAMPVDISAFISNGAGPLIRVLIWAPAVYLVYYLLKMVYRITLHPLARFPGPKLTAMTRCYEAYYEVFVDGTGGKFGEKIEEWHRQYGPIVRINPFELHVNDAEYFDELFNFNPHLWKRTFAIDNLVHTPSSAQHKRRRQVLQNYFSQQNTNQMTHIVRERIEAVCKHLREHRDRGAVVKASLLFRAMTTDIICQYAFGRHWRFVEDPEYSEGYFSSTQNTFKNIYFFREYKIVNDIALAFSAMPDWLFPKGKLKNVTTWAEAMTGQIRSEKDGGPPTIFAEYQNNKLADDEKTPNRIFQVSLMVMGAGAGTPSYVLDIATYYMLADPAVKARVKAEVLGAWPDASEPAPPVAVLEGLPYLRGCVKEALRLALGPMARLQRVNPHEEMRYGEWVIPRNTPIGMTHRFIHHNPDIYPEPFEFRPERWMEGDKSRRLEKYLVTFSRGSRQCLAIPLAYAEIYLCLATLFRQFDLELHDTDRKCVDPRFDYFAPFPEKHDLTEERVRLLVK